MTEASYSVVIETIIHAVHDNIFQYFKQTQQHDNRYNTIRIELPDINIR